MKKEQEESEIKYFVVKNFEEQYSIYPSHKTIPHGWEVVGEEGTKEECLSYINEVWTDMRPLSLRTKMNNS